ncbi:sterol desaturase family protein [Streptomyces millisiae]|uniref:sterol desaturase family protein n=1 Tax=Streptomyces millisiae TaxID=3075542 RepID=UPI00288B3DE9|nr:sterol desaturase family protein [Streptomyces sp. DSM 44918]
MDLRSPIDSEVSQSASQPARPEQVPAWARVLRHVAYPVLLGLVVTASVLGIARDWQPEAVGFLFVLVTLLYLGVLERLIPYDRTWHPSRREWRWYGGYFLVTAFGGAVAQAIVLALIAVVAMPDSFLPLVVEIPLAALLASLANYLVHRLAHTNRLLWRLHGVHHTPDKVNVGNNGVNNVLDVVLTQGATQLALALVGFSETAVFAVGLFVVAQGYFTHVNADVRIGWLNHVVSSPEQHRLHHSTDLSEAGHYAADLSVWDRVFGSFTWRPGRRPVSVGLADPTSFPPTGAVFANQFRPWRRPAG